jgi:mRNA-degrading endonuclease RelE of RelBE toxin-antitoxin system
MKYRVFIEQSAVEAIAGVRGKKRQKLKDFVRLLEENPYDEGDFHEFDDTGRKTFSKIVADHAVSYFADHAVKEVKIFEVVKADE